MGIELDVDESGKEYLIDKGYDEKYGARPLRRAIQSLLEDSLAEKILDGTVKEENGCWFPKGRTDLSLKRKKPLAKWKKFVYNSDINTLGGSKTCR